MNDIITIIKSPYLWLILLLFVVIMYLFLSLFNHSFKKPLKVLGITIIISGILFIIIRFFTPALVNLLFEEYANMVNILIPRILKTITIIGIVYILIGVLSIFLYHKINDQN